MRRVELIRWVLGLTVAAFRHVLHSVQQGGAGIAISFLLAAASSICPTYQGLTEPQYPFHDRTITVTHCGRICIGKRKISFSHVFAGQQVGIREIEEKIWLVGFMHYDLGFFDYETGRVE